MSAGRPCRCSRRKSASRAKIFVMPPERFATATLPDKLTDVRDGLPSASGRVA